jgi:hypothetical protein
LEALRLFGVGIFLVTSLAVGTRLLVLAARTRQMPELALGVTLFASGGLGGILYFLGTSRAEELGALAVWVRGGGRLCLSAGALTLWGFTWRVFRPDSRWAAALFSLAASAVVAGFVGEGLATGSSGGNFDAVWSRLGVVARGLAFLWAAIESFRYFGLLRRRLRVGLADPVMVNRFLVWGIATSTAFGIYAVALVNLLESSAHDVAAGVFRPSWALLTSVLGITSGVCTWLSFLAPAPYRRWLESAAANSSSSEPRHRSG